MDAARIHVERFGVPPGEGVTTSAPGSLPSMAAAETTAATVTRVRDGLTRHFSFNPGDDSLLGGAGSLDHISELIENVGVIGASAGSLFVFKGKYRAVLINYPSPIITC